MNARIINLRTHRKRKARDDAKTKADANAVEHGRTKAERSETDALNTLEVRRLDGHRRDVDGADGAHTDDAGPGDPEGSDG